MSELLDPFREDPDHITSLVFFREQRFHVHIHSSWEEGRSLLHHVLSLDSRVLIRSQSAIFRIERESIV